MTMMTIDVTKLAGAFGPFIDHLCRTGHLHLSVAYFITFRTCCQEL